MNHDVEGEAGFLITRIRASTHGSHVVVTREALQAGALVEQRVDLIELIPPTRIRWKIAAGSMSPVRVP